jgi:hypothetical protein
MVNKKQQMLVVDIIGYYACDAKVIRIKISAASDNIRSQNHTE